MRKFLWDSYKGDRKINLVGWAKVCRPKDEGGLGFVS